MKVAATTGLVAEIAREVGGEEVKVKYLMGPGVDPHLYKVSEGDIARLAEARVIFCNGLNLEGKMGDILVKMARTGRMTVAVSESVDKALLREPPEFLGHYDPHIWFPQVVDALAEATHDPGVDPQGRPIPNPTRKKEGGADES